MNGENDREMDEVTARTTPGTDPRVEELAREHDREAGTERGPGMEHEPHMQRETGMDREPDVDRGTDMNREPASGPEMGAHHGTVMDRGNLVDRGEYGAGPNGELDEYRNRFADAQSRFIDDPKRAVEEARSVVEAAVDRLMRSAADESASGDDTEHMRMAMQRYRSLFDRLIESTR